MLRHFRRRHCGVLMKRHHPPARLLFSRIHQNADGSTCSALPTDSNRSLAGDPITGADPQPMSRVGAQSLVVPQILEPSAS